MKLEYLQYDENFALARKCTWALTDIGTDAAMAKLQELAGSSNPKIRSYARKRLENWQGEIHRKRGP
jgi:HEAT repeat protein